MNNWVVIYGIDLVAVAYHRAAPSNRFRVALVKFHAALLLYTPQHLDITVNIAVLKIYSCISQG